MWHIMLCGLLALPALSEFDLREKSEKALLTEQNCESCPTCAKCAKNDGFHEARDRNCATPNDDSPNVGQRPSVCLHVGRVVSRSTARLRFAAPGARRSPFIRRLR